MKTGTINTHRLGSKITAAILLVFLFLSLTASGEDVLYIKSDSTWKATDNVDQVDWFKPEYESSSWGDSTSVWKNNPCSENCEKIKSCEVSCLDWMWYGDSCDNCTRYFKKTVEIPGDIKSALFTISGDDAYWLYVNGNFVGSDERKLGYANAESYDIANILHEGKNVIAIKAEDKQGPEGVVVSSKVEYTSTVKQLQAQLATLQAQVNTLSEDKKTLQQRADSLEAQLQTANNLNKNLEKTLSDLRLSSQSLNNELAGYKSGLAGSQRTSRLLMVALIIIILSVAVVGDYVHEKYIKKRKPTLSTVPIKKEEIKPHTKNVRR